MESTVKERIIEFIRFKNISQKAFEKEVGLSNGYVNNIRRSIQPDKLQKIALQYPDLNTGWLMTGEGEMIRNNQQIGDITSSTVIGANVSGNGVKITHNDFSGMIELQKGYQDLLKKKDDHISELLLIVSKLTSNGK
jgi:transcriptional regulator with XRE-family HTH domain